MKKDFKFGIENEFMLLDKETNNPLGVKNLNFFDLREIILNIDTDKKDIRGFNEKEPNKSKKPYYIEGYDNFDADGTINETVPKGIELRTPIRSSIDEMLSLYNQLLCQLKRSMLTNGYKLCLISHHPTESQYRGKKATRTKDKWVHAQGAVHTFGPDINIGFKKSFKINIKQFEKRLYYYAPAMVAFSLNSPVYKGKLWKGKSIRVFNRSFTGPVYLYHPEQKRFEFKNYDVTNDYHDLKAYTFLFLTVLLDSSMQKGSNEKTCKKELREIAINGWNKKIEKRAEDLLNKANKTLKFHGFDPSDLNILQKRLNEKTHPSDFTRKLFQESKDLSEYLGKLSEIS